MISMLSKGAFAIVEVSIMFSRNMTSQSWGNVRGHGLVFFPRNMKTQPGRCGRKGFDERGSRKWTCRSVI